MIRVNITVSAMKEYLQKETVRHGLIDSEVFTTAFISQKLNISRTLTSQYLNQLLKNGEVVKIATRPVYFFDKVSLERKLQIKLRYCEYLSMEELQNEVKNGFGYDSDFDSLIGRYGSLNECIQQIKAALNYPDNGLPILLVGEQGVGKNCLVEKAFEYLKKQNKIGAKAKLNVISLNHDNYQQEFERLFHIEKGILKIPFDGLVYIKNCEFLSLSLQMKLANYLQDKQTIKQRLIFSVNSKTVEILHRNLQLQVPVVCKIGGFDERFEDEKEQFIIQYFLREVNSLNRQIFVSRKVIETLKNHSYEHHLNGLGNVIRNLCASVYTSMEQETLEIGLLDLPNYILNDYVVEIGNDEKIDILTYKTHLNEDMTLIFFEKLIQCYYKYKENLDVSMLLEESGHLVRTYYDYLIFESDFPPQQIKSLERIVTTILKKYRNSVPFNLPLNSNDFLARMLYQSVKKNSLLKKFEEDYSKELRDLDCIFNQYLINEYILSTKIVKLINRTVDCTLPQISNIFLSLNLHMFNHEISNQDTVGIILTHGYMTASSMAEAVNTLLKTKVFEAIDMSLDLDADSIVEKVNIFVSQNPYYRNILLLVDMGSLEQIQSKITSNVNIGIINHVSTAMALNVGAKVLQNISMEDILHQTIEEMKYSCKIVSKARKDDAVVFTSDAGMKVSEKLIQLFKESLPENIPLHFIEIDYNRLSKNGINDVIFKKYNVSLVIRPYGLRLQNIPQVSLENIINNKDIGKINHVLQKYLSVEEIRLFNQSLLKNFSLISIMENAMILNAKVLLDGVSEAVAMLERMMNYKLKSKTIVGVYIHICFLIERLVTRSNIEKEWDGTSFLNHHGDFVKNVEICFASLLKNYNVTIPLEEISYLFDYIKNDMVGDLDD